MHNVLSWTDRARTIKIDDDVVPRFPLAGVHWPHLPLNGELNSLKSV
jgi:hypothetical protein